jgi:hypothetical protein
MTDVYGYTGPDLASARASVQEVLAIDLEEHESLYRGGIYFLHEAKDGEIIVQTNCDLIDGEPTETDFSNFGIILYVTLRGSDEIGAREKLKLFGWTFLVRRR